MALRNAERLDRIHPTLYEFAQWAASHMPCDLSVVQGERSFPAQAELYAQGRTKPGEVVTTLQAGESAHNYRLAVDFHPIVRGPSGPRAVADHELEWDMLGDLVARWNSERRGLPLMWGGFWKNLVDKPHVEIQGWRDIKSWDRGDTASPASSTAPKAKTVLATAFASLVSGALVWVLL